jgi:hypothetical protein
MGVPVGIAAGRSAWSVAVNQLGIVGRPEVPTIGVTMDAVVLMSPFVAVAVVLLAWPDECRRRGFPESRRNDS